MNSGVDVSKAGLLWAARVCEWRGDFAEAQRLATEALERDGNFVEALLVRAVSRRVVGALEGAHGAIADYTRCIEIDPDCDCAFRFRAACLTELASRRGTAEMRSSLHQAEEDLAQAVRLDPANEQAMLSLIETAILGERYREAFGHAGEAWSAVRDPGNRVIGAWLGCIAGILAGRPRRTWERYLDELQARHATLGPLSWCVAEINGVLARVEAEGRYDAGALADLASVHELFLGHFEERPVLR